MKKLIILFAFAITSCAQSISEHEVLVKGEGVEFVIRVNASDFNDARSEARRLLVSRGYPAEQLNKVKFYESN